MKKFATVTVSGQKLELDAPGLKIQRPSGKGPYVFWSAPPAAIAAGFRPKNVRLHPDWDDPADFDRIARECREWQAKVVAWGSGEAVHRAPVPGTLGALAEEYQRADDSPFHAVRLSTRSTYLRWLKLLAPYGDVRLVDVDHGRLSDWYAELGQPEEGDQEPRRRRASSGLQMLRILFRFGAERSIAECSRLLDLAMSPDFDMKPVRREPMSAENAERFVDCALSIGDVRMALAQACQFELGLRQSEVIGEWVPIQPDDGPGPDDIVFQRQRWTGGLTFDMPVLAGIDLSTHPLVAQCLELIEDKRGPVVVREDGRPFDRFTFSRRWRAVAKAAGLPDHVQNMDSRKRE
ncbi:hypothetical protein [Kaistia sp. UC242_56]|uniref:hypothetical protein n=1 Tax=Kaistia sp. UC242_56 TaxID=3374625 RepID=UPI0037A3120C